MDLYRRDTYSWVQAAALRKRDLDAIDWTNVIEELQYEDELEAYYAVILELLLDLQYGIGDRSVPQIEAGIYHVRDDVTTALRRRPGLREELLAQAWDQMRRDTFVEFPEQGWDQAIPRDNPYTLRQVEDFDC